MKQEDLTALIERIKDAPTYTGKELDCLLYRVDRGEQTATKNQEIFMVAAESRAIIVEALQHYAKQ